MYLFFIKGLFIFIAIVSVIGCGGEAAKSSETVAKEQFQEKDQLTILNERIAADTTNAQLYYDRCRLLISNNDIVDAADDILRALELEPENAKYYETASVLLLQVNDSRAAINMLQRGLDIKPLDVPLRLQLGRLYLIVRQYEQANEQFDRIIAFAPTEAAAYHFKALVLKEQGKDGEMTPLLEKAIQYDPEFTDAYMQLGMLYSKKKDPLAIQYFDNALRVEPKRIDALYAKGYFYQRQEDFSNAKKAYRAIMKIDPQYEFAIYNVGYLLMLEDSLAASEKHFNMAVKVAPSYADAYQMRGFAAELQGKKEQALRDYEQALIFEEGHPKATEGIKRLKAEK